MVRKQLSKRKIKMTPTKMDSIKMVGLKKETDPIEMVIKKMGVDEDGKWL